MKRICLFLLVILIVSVYTDGANNLEDKETGKDGIHSFCTEGKKWHYTLLDVSATPIRQSYSYEVRGDTVVGEMSYKKIYQQKDGQERLAFMMREQGDKVFKINPDKEEQLFFDFGRDDVGIVYSWNSWDGLYITNWMISCIDSVMVNNNIFRRYCSSQKYSEMELKTFEDENGWVSGVDIWVEGVGDARYGVDANGLEVTIRLPGITEYFDSCEVNGECIFTADDFERPAYTTDMQRAKNKVLQDESLFDLSGRRIMGTPPKGIYIIKGKKVLK